ncbi:MAG: hypothetical protein LBF97_01285, partial [Elusimicrobiota bacterium]|nr:hypothetical protein [Elusimicrobiota bacterium]
YVADCERSGTLYAHASTWLNQDRWEDAPSTIPSRIAQAPPAFQPKKTIDGNSPASRTTRRAYEMLGLDYRERSLEYVFDKAKQEKQGQIVEVQTIETGN